MFSFKEFLKSEITNILAKYFQKIHDYDEYFFQNRDKNQYKIDSRVNRTVNTPIGVGTFRQRVYWDTINKQYYIIQFMKNLVLKKEQELLMIYILIY
ncbi:hypothetical protein [Spiroplasma endosymbiont of Danaus chrysippus]|uniref:hypothetical protein n=1 Tax=Spiroplasma endosymbiont of Danaus chrysippus TaxID=2691041 RepID=UPI00157B08B3|nr:hypothetical protein [Spiroplasma endosymbiont of Danaus chrysippus]